MARAASQAHLLLLLKIWVLMLVEPIAILGLAYYRTQGYLGPALAGPKSILGLALPMIQCYFGCCNLRDPRIVGSWRSPSATYVLGSAQHTSSSPSATCALVLPVHRRVAQAPRVRLVYPAHRLGRPSARWPRPGAWPAGVAYLAPRPGS